jgi:hypothetical protein
MRTSDAAAIIGLNTSPIKEGEIVQLLSVWWHPRITAVARADLREAPTEADPKRRSPGAFRVHRGLVSESPCWGDDPQLEEHTAISLLFTVAGLQLAAIKAKDAERRRRARLLETNSQTMRCEGTNEGVASMTNLNTESLVVEFKKEVAKIRERAATDLEIQSMLEFVEQLTHWRGDVVREPLINALREAASK